MRPFSPFGHSPSYKPRFPSRWSVIIGDIDHGYEELHPIIWGNIVMLVWVMPWLIVPSFWVYTGCGIHVHAVITSAGREFALLWGLALLGAVVTTLLIFGFGRRKD